MAGSEAGKQQETLSTRSVSSRASSEASAPIQDAASSTPIDGPSEKSNPAHKEARQDKQEQPSLPHENAPPLPDEPSPGQIEEDPPLPDEAIPGTAGDDGWDAVFDENTQSWYFYNRFTQKTQWENPRVPSTNASSAPGLSSSLGVPGTSSPAKRVAGGYNPAIHGDYDPNADYAIEAQKEEEEQERAAAGDPASMYMATGTFNRFTGRWQAAHLDPENFNDENKSRRQMSAFFDVDAAANSHDGRSLKAERAGKKLSKAEVKAFQQKRREKKEEKRRAWLRD